MATTAIGRTKNRTTSRHKEVEAEMLPAPLRWSLWILGAGFWLFMAAAMVSFSDADAPSRAVAVHNATAQNLCGAVGAFFAYWTYDFLGIGAWILMIGAAVWLVLSARGRGLNQPLLRSIGLLLAALAFSGFHALWFPDSGATAGSPAGLIAHATVEGLTDRIGGLGTFLVLAATILIGLIIAMDELMLSLPSRCWAMVTRFEMPQFELPRLGDLAASPMALLRRNGHVEYEDEYEDGDDLEYEDGEEDEYEEEEEEDEDEYEYEYEDEEEEEVVAKKPARKKPARKNAAEPEIEQKPAKKSAKDKFAKFKLKARTSQKIATDADLRRDESYDDYKFPPVELLSDPQSNFTEKAEASVRKQAEMLEQALQTYSIEGTVEGIEAGPTVTLYSVQLAPGTKVSKLSTLAKDIARSLSAKNIRIVPTMAGRSTVGIEVPNIVREKVAMKELIASGRDQGMILPMFMGKDANGEPLVMDLARMPHMLIAGTTGSGKSVCINSIIMSWLYMKRPDEVKLILVDPKMVELSQFEHIPHLACPVITDMGRAAASLEWAVQKMEERYTLFQEAGVRNITSYNAMSSEEKKEIFDIQNEVEKAKVPDKLHYIVFVIDELADLMLTNKEVEQSIVRIAQKARAVGIHLILATQRPQANVVTGLIKSNMPCRVSCKVASGMDSRIVLDGTGAELLMGNGDLMYVTPANPDISRGQGTFVSDGETRKVVKFLKEVAKPSFERSLIQVRNVNDKNAGGAPEEFDPLFDQAVRIIIETGRGSVSLLQRRLAIGYSRSSRLVDQMGMVGVLGEHVGSKAREVLMTMEDWEQFQAQEDEDTGDPVYVDDDPDCLDDPVPAEYGDEYQS
tara:strand:- start:4344 stop:6899 length:2556 start_codon:yes stop_codon:yes gene_type:complete